MIIRNRIYLRTFNFFIVYRHFKLYWYIGVAKSSYKKQLVIASKDKCNHFNSTTEEEEGEDLLNLGNSTGQVLSKSNLIGNYGNEI